MLDALLITAGCAASFVCGRFMAPWPGALPVAAGLAGLVATDSLVPAILATAVPWLAGCAVRSRQELLARVRARTQMLESEQDALARLSVQRERAHIARELHDIVGHHLAVIVVQAGAGRMATKEVSSANERFARIRQSGEQALSEMDRLVELLGESDEVPAAPQSLVDLVDQAQAAGMELTSEGLPVRASLSPEVEQLAYGVVREGLTNAMKHAPGSSVSLCLATGPDLLRIKLHNSPGQAPSGLARTGSGMGLSGLRERLDAIGGELETAPEGGGWKLRASIPLT
jgi:signal transduction histidine kinase